MTRTYAVIAGGGTGGHVIPALAIGRALVDRGHPADTLHYVGSERGLETRLVPEAGFTLTALPGRGIQRKLTVENVPAVAGLGRAVITATSLIRSQQPRIVVAVGGYASIPCAVAAARLRIPFIVHEQNAVPGAANRLVARFARVSAVSYEGTRLPRPVVTGNPVRPAVLDVDRTTGRLAARRALGLPEDRLLIASFGGSLGARHLNLALRDAVSQWTERTDLAVYHVVGERDWDEMSGSEPALPPGGLIYRAVRYEERMELLYAAADLFVCRAGGNTVAELAAVGVPSVLVPLPGAPGDHQTANARVLAGAGAAVLMADRDLSGPRLAATVVSLLSDVVHLDAMSRAATGLGRRDAAERIAALAEEHARD